MFPEDTLDFHDSGPLTEDQIRLMTETFLENSQKSGMDCVLIITGKGTHGRSIGLAKKTVLQTLQNNKLIQSFKTAGTLHGGEGAFTIILNPL